MVRLVAFVAGMFLIASAYPIDPNRAMSQYPRDQWGTERGFPRGPIYAISQTSDGYLWIGTAAGLIRFDGKEFRMVNDVSGTFTIAGVHGLAADNSGSLWLRLQDSTLLRYRGGVFESLSSVSKREHRASAMSRTNRGEIMIAEAEQGAFAFRDGAFHLLASASHLSRTPVTALAQMPDGDIWMGTREAGLFRFPQGNNFSRLNVLPNGKMNCLLVDGDHGLWIGTDDGIFRWDGKELTTAGAKAASKGFQVLSMARDRDANLWIGTDSRGLLRYNSRGFAGMGEISGLSHDAVTALFEDREGNVWIGSASGLHRLSDSAFVTYSLREGLATDGNDPVFVDEDNTMWFPPVEGGLSWAKDGHSGKISVEGLDRDVVYSIAGGNGDLWLGRKHGGLTRLRSENGSFGGKTYTQADGLAQNSVFSVSRASDGSVWAGTLSAGVSKLNNGKFTTYSIADGLASNTVQSILEDRNGTEWFATPSGLSAFSRGRWHTYVRGDGLPSLNVDCLLEDGSGVLWAGTDAGLAFGDSRGFRIPAGIPPSLREPILGIAEDRFGWLWISASNHVLRVKRDKLMNGVLADGDIREFGPADGLLGVEGVKRHRSVVTDPLGRIWFSLKHGISSIDPARLAQNQAPAIVHMQKMLADNQAIRMGDLVHVPGGRKRITFGFIGLSLSSPEKVRFRYRLDSYDRDWSEPSATPEATYTNLRPGSYRFRVIASNSGGVWSNDEAALAVEVDSLYWQTWWFAAMVGTAVVLSVSAIYRMRLRQITHRLNVRFDERLAERTRLARDLHDTLLQTIQGSKMVADDGLDDPADQARVYHALERVSNFLAQATLEGRAALSSLRSSSAEHGDLAEAFERAGEDCNQKNSMTFALNLQGTSRKVPLVVRDEVYRIGHEAMRNACLHSRGTRLEVEVSYARDLTVRIRDNGIGIDPGLLAKGKAGHFGITGMRERAERMGARLHLKSTSSGTEVELIVPGNLAFGEKNGQRGLFRKF